MVPTLAATVYAAQESSLYLGGAIVPMENVPAGSTSLQVPILSLAGAAEEDSAASAFGSDDFTSTAITDTTVTIPVSVLARRTILRDVGGVNPASIGRQLGQSVAKAFDQKVTGLFTSFATNSAVVGSGTSNALTVDDVIDGATALKTAGEYGQLMAVLHPEQVANILKDINSTSFAGGDFQSEALRNGFRGTLYGVMIFESSFITATTDTDNLWEGAMFSRDAMRIAMQKNVDLEVARRAEAVGFDVVANLHAGVGIVDNARGILIKSTGNTVET
tara:strand:+ start:458 stop:1285 length:828 start_codon:yes stop_codon:yes gene_type:complete